MNTMHNTLITLLPLPVLSLAIAHMGWLVTQSGMFRPLRERVSHTAYTSDMGMVPYRLVQLQSVLAEGIECSICTITQLSLLLAWLVPDLIVGPAPLVYFIKAMLLAKLSCIVYDLGEAIGVLSLGTTYEGGTESVDAG